MAEIHVRRPDGAVVAVDEADYQKALNAGYQNVSQDEANAARDVSIGQMGESQAVASGALQAPADYSPGMAAAEKALSAASFGWFAPHDPASAAAGLRFQAEHPYAAFGAELVGQLPLAIATGGAGAGIRAGATGALSRAGAFGADFALNAAVGGAQTEFEEARLTGKDVTIADIAITGAFGETLGRGAFWAGSRALGGARNLMARGERDLVAQDAEKSLTRGGWLADYRVAQHADQYHNELAELAARDLDQLETNFVEVSRQDRKRARITRAVQDSPEVQGEIRVEAAEGLRGLRAALADELADAGGPAKTLLRQLDDRIAELDAAPTGKKLWRTLDENRQALQEYRQDLYQAYEANPGAAWLSREGLAAIDAAEKSTREALLREDAWGEAAARMQREYNVPFNEKYFPAAKTVRTQLMESPTRDARGFPVFRGEPGKVRRFLARGADDVDAHRLAEQFSGYLDGVEAIARAGAQDTPVASRNTLEAVRRLRRAVANARQISEAAARDTTRAGRIAVAADVAAGAAGAAAFGVPGAVGFAGASRGLRVGHWLAQAAQKLGWGSGAPLDMAALLGKDALPEPPAGARDADLVDDILDAERPSGPPSGPPPGGGAPSNGGMRWTQTAPGESVDEYLARQARMRGEPAAGGGLTPSMRADAARASWRPSAPPDSGVRGTMADELAPGESPDVVPEPGLRDRPTVPVGAREVHRGQQEAMELDPLRDLAGPAQREAGRLEALAEGEFRDVVAKLKATGNDDARELAEALEAGADDLAEAGLVSKRPAPSLDEVDEFYRRRASERSQPATPSVTPAAAGADAAFRELGLQIRMGAERLGETLDTVFGAGRAPTPEQWRQIIPLDQLQRLAPTAKARIDVLGDSFIWSAEGQAADRFSDDAWRISRSFFRDDAGKLEVHHDHFFIREDLQGSGVGAEVLKSMMDVYRKVGVDVVSVDAIEVGKYFWPSIGFNAAPADVTKAVNAYRRWLDQRGYDTAELARIKSLPSLAQAEYGKEFLLEVPGPWNSGLRLELKDENPLYHLMRGRLDVAAAALATLGGGALEGKEGDQPGPAAAAMAPLALFGRRVNLFKQARARAVTDVAKRLFSATAEPAARTAGRLVYNRAQVKARQDEFQSWQENPQELVDRVAEGFREVPPEHSGTVASGVFAAATFLKQRLPTVTKINAVSLRQIPVSTEAMAKYARYEQAALRPREALAEAAAGGHISTELMETLGELYPDLLAELRVAAIQQVRENGPPTTVQSKLSYARLFDGRGELADPSMSQTVANMTAFAYEQAVPPKPGGGPTSSGNVSHVAAASAAPRMGRG